MSQQPSRYRFRVDSNQAEIVAALRAAGATVQPIHSLGQGVPDLLVGWNGSNLLIEVKDGSKSPSRRQLTADEAKWISTWSGQVAVIADVDQVLALLKDRS